MTKHGRVATISAQRAAHRHSHMRIPGSTSGILRTLAAAFAVVFAAQNVAAEDLTTPRYFDDQIQPLLSNYCGACHSTEKQKGELDLERFTSLAEASKHPKVWISVIDQLANQQMPPEEERQLLPAERDRLIHWARNLLDQIGRARAGDPGPVVLRRLSNAEYTYTIRDLTGIQTLEPAREFPVDGAAGEGFMNTGNALVMSPSLLAKYLDAAKGVADHAVLLPNGIRFSRHTTRRDWTEEILDQIRAFYDQFTEPSGGDKVNLQGIVFETNEGGRLPLERYLSATLIEREALASGSKSIDAVAREHGLSPKYLQLLWNNLQRADHSVILNRIAAAWRKANPSNAGSLASEIVQWQKALWKFSTVGHIGKRGGPKAWMEPANPIVAEHEIRLKLPSAPTNSTITIYLAASDAGDGNTGDHVIWKQPRLIAKEKPDLLLQDLVKFRRHPDGSPIDPEQLRVQAPSMIEILVPSELGSGCEFAVTGLLNERIGSEGSVQLQVSTVQPEDGSGLRPGAIGLTDAGGTWTSNNAIMFYSAPILVNQGSTKWRSFETAFDAFRELFPAALCYTKIVPVDEVVTLTLFYREDHHLRRLMLDEKQQAEIDRLWAELRLVSQDALKLVDVFEQLWQYATQDADPQVFEPLRQPILDRAAAFKQLLVDTEPKHVEAVVEFADRAFRRPLTSCEARNLRALYRRLREEELPHDEAIRLLLARVLVAPAFLYRLEKAAPGAAPGPVSDWELANRLSYFLWSSMPDDELRELAASGKLGEPDVLSAQAQRMMSDPRARRLAIEFACQWLQIRDFDVHDEKSERHFPGFGALRGAMYEEAVQFFTDLFRNNRSVLEILDADYTFLNDTLAAHYQIPGIAGPDWRRVNGVRAFERGGILGFAAVLAKQSGASRTSPILRGHWISETILGEKLPRPPKDVPELPEPESSDGLTVRQLVERHTTDPRCANCHKRIDPFGFALEQFDAIGRLRQVEPGGGPIDTRAELVDGSTFEGISGLRDYLLTRRKDAVLRQFCVKLLGYALGRAVLISDEPLLAEMQAELKANDNRVGAAVARIVRSSQFRMIRGKEQLDEL